MTSDDELPFVQSQNGDEDNPVSNDKSFEQTMNNPVNNSLKCSGCKQYLPLSAFYVTTNFWHEKRGRTYKCKECSRKASREYIDRKKQGKVKDENLLPGG